MYLSPNMAGTLALYFRNSRQLERSEKTSKFLFAEMASLEPINGRPFISNGYRAVSNRPSSKIILSSTCWASARPRIERLRRTSDPQKWSEKASSALPDARASVSQTQNKFDLLRASDSSTHQIVKFSENGSSDPLSDAKADANCIRSDADLVEWKGAFRLYVYHYELGILESLILAVDAQHD